MVSDERLRDVSGLSELNGTAHYLTKTEQRSLCDECLQARATLANRAAVREPGKCEHCDGIGAFTKEDRALGYRCIACNGTGQRSIEPKTETLADLVGDARGEMADYLEAIAEPKTETCATCDGTKRVYDFDAEQWPDACPDCSPPVAPRPAVFCKCGGAVNCTCDGTLTARTFKFNDSVRPADGSQESRYPGKSADVSPADGEGLIYRKATLAMLEAVQRHPGCFSPEALREIAGRAITLLSPATPPAMSDEVRDDDFDLVKRVLDDLLADFADTEFDEKDVDAARKRICAYGTIGYIANANAALKRLRRLAEQGSAT